VNVEQVTALRALLFHNTRQPCEAAARACALHLVDIVDQQQREIDDFGTSRHCRQKKQHGACNQAAGAMKDMMMTKHAPLPSYET
jgi:hypothetical protein